MPTNRKNVREPTSRSDYINILIASYKPEWKHEYGISKTDIREMSLSSLRKLYKRVNQDNYFNLLGGE